MQRQKYFYRWVILAASFLLMAVPFSLVNTIHTLFIAPVTTEKGFSLSAFSLIFTLSAVVVAAASPIVGRLLRWISIRWIMAAGAVLVGMGFIAYSFANTIAVFYGIGIVIAVGMTALTTIPISTMITHWFAASRGTALGVAFAGAGTGTFFWMQIVSRILEGYGYHYAYLLLGGFILLIALPIALFLAAKSPAEKYRLAAHDAEVSLVEKRAGGAAELLALPSFRYFAAGLLLMGIAVSGVQIHVQPYLVSLGYALAYNANVGSTLAISALAGSVAGGVIFDRLPVKGAVSFFGACALIALTALLFADIQGVPYGFAILFGISLCLPSLWPAYGVGRIFPDADYATALGTANLFFVAGGALGPFFSGVMADSALGYPAAWIVYLLLTGLYMMLFYRSLRDC